MENGWAGKKDTLFGKYIFTRPMSDLIGIYKHLFEPRLTVSPRLYSFVEGDCSPDIYAGDSRETRWLFDYSFTPCGRYRIGEDPCWKLRDQFVARLTAPGVRIVEDVACNAAESHLRFVYFSFSHEDGEELMSLTNPSGYALFIDPDRKLPPLLERMKSCVKDLEDSGFWLAQGMLCEILMILLHSIRIDINTFLIPPIPHILSSSDFAQRVHAFFLAHISEEITVEVLAEHLKVSISSISHKYKKETGVTPMVTLQTLRIQLAKTLLKKGYRLCDIAPRIGFCNEFHLSKIFKQLEGVTPNEFRKSHSNHIKGR